MRIVVFTALPDIESTPWWSIIANTPRLTDILVVHKTTSRKPAAIARRFWKNVKRHGWLFVPYRAAALAVSVMSELAHSDSAARSAATPAGIDVRTLRTLDMHHPFVIETVQDWSPDLGLSIGAPILRPSLFEIPSLGTLNVHLGKVPDFRGAPPGFWEMWYGATEIGATIHWVDAGLDTGAIVESGVAPIYERDSLKRVELRAAELGYGLLRVAIDRVARGDADSTPQPVGGRTNRAPVLAQRFALWRRLALRRARARAADPLALAKLLVAIAWLKLWHPVRDLMRTVTGRHPVRIFTYHRVTDLCRDGMTISESEFRRQLEYLRRHHTIVDFDRALELLAPGQRIHHPVALLTFDDGYRSVKATALPPMKELGMPGVSFVCTGLVDTDRRLAHDSANPARGQLSVMGWRELQELRDAGWHIGGHTVDHARLSELDGSALTREVVEPLAQLKPRFDADHVAMAYPFGGRDDITPDGVATVKRAGYSALFSDFGGENFPGDDPMTLRRIELGGDHDSVMWKAAALGLDLTAWKHRLRRGDPPMLRASGASRGTLRLHRAKGVRVTHVVFDLDGGGMESLVAAMAARWSGTDVRMSVITLSGRVGRVGEQVRSLVDQFHVLRLVPGLSMALPHGLVRALRTTAPNVVHLHTGAWFKGAYAARLAGVPRVVYTEHGREHRDPALSRLQDHFASCLTHNVVAVSERLRTYLARALRVSQDRLVTVTNGVDTRIFSPAAPNQELRAALSIPENAIVVGSVGRLEPVKAYERLVAAFAELRKFDFGKPLALVIFGEGSARAAIEREIDRLGVRDSVRLPGWTSNPADGYRLFDLFAMTSRSEGMSVSLMEAMACGICPLVTDVGSNAEVLGPGLRAHAIADGDEWRFLEVARELLQSASKRQSAGAMARVFAMRCHSLDRMLEEYERLYRGEAPGAEPADMAPHPLGRGVAHKYSLSAQGQPNAG